ncbi:MAG: glycosyltransferase family 4 protein [bacterium]
MDDDDRRDGVGPGPGKRVLVLAPEPFYEDRGTPIAVRAVLEALSERGLAVDLVTYPVGGTPAIPGVEIHRVGRWLPIRRIRIGFSWSKVLLDLLMIPAMLRLGASRRYALVHAVEESAFLAVLLRHWLGAPVLYDMQSSLPEQLREVGLFRGRWAQGVLRGLERWLLENADSIVCSAGLAAHVRALAPGASVNEWQFPAPCLSVAPGELEELRRDLGIGPRSRVVLYTGNFEPYQGVGDLVEAAFAVHSRLPEACFLLAGADGPSAATSSAHAKQLISRKALRILPRAPREDVLRLVAIADVVVSPRKSGANVGLKVFDYLAFGKPIVATDSPTHRSVLDEDCALLVPATPDELAQAIVTLLTDHGRAAELGAGARRYAEANLSWGSFVQRLEKTYGTAAARTGSH